MKTLYNNDNIKKVFNLEDIRLYNQLQNRNSEAQNLINQYQEQLNELEREKKIYKQQIDQEFVNKIEQVSIQLETFYTNNFSLILAQLETKLQDMTRTVLSKINIHVTDDMITNSILEVIDIYFPNETKIKIICNNDTYDVLNQECVLSDKEIKICIDDDMLTGACNIISPKFNLYLNLATTIEKLKNL